MDLRKLRYFSVLAEEKHFGRAARRLSLSQPPLSLAIRQLEREIGARLFERNSRNVSLTAAGVALQREATLLLRRVDETRGLVKAIAEGQRGQLRLAFGGSMLYRGLPRIVERFRAAAPSTELRLRELNSAEQVEALHRDEIDLGFIHGRATPAGLEGFRYHSEPFVACVPDGHPCAKAKTLQLARLRDEDFVLFAQAASPDYYQSIIATCLSAGFTPRVRHEVRHWTSVVSFVANGMGVALVPRSLRTSHIKGVAFVPIRQPGVVSETWCVWKADNQGAALNRLIDAARQQSAAMARSRSR
jgi:DNA-binding transcriptional LysR family regulator